MQNISLRSLFIVGFLMTVVGVVIFLLKGILLPFLLAGLLAYFLSPIILKLQALGFKRQVAVLILFSVFLVVFSATVYFIFPAVLRQGTSLKNKMPEYSQKIKNSFYNLERGVEDKLPFAQKAKFVDDVEQRINTFIYEQKSHLPSYLLRFFSVFSLLVLIPMLTFFMLLVSGGLFDSMLRYLPTKYAERGLGLLYEIDEMLGRYIRGQLIEVLFVGILSTIGLLLLGINYALLIGSVAGIFNVIPYLGPIAGTIPAVVVGFMEYQNFAIVLKVILMFIVVQYLDNHIIQPIVIGQGVKLSPVVIIFSVMAGAQLFGFLGILFAVPFVGMIKVVFIVLFRKPAICSDCQKILL